MKIALPMLLASSALLGQAPDRSPQPPSTGEVTKTTPPPAPEMVPVDPFRRSRANPDRLAAPETKQMAAVPSAVREALLGIRPSAVAFDQPIEGGALWALGSNYKASFATDGWTFIAQPAADAPAASPLQFQLVQVTANGEPLALSHATPRRLGNRVALDRGSVVEAIDLSLQHVEQTFTFATLPNRGELVVAIDIATDMVAEQHGDGLRFQNPWNDVTYSGAVAIDADGDRIAAATEIVDGQIRIRVPQSFVAAASLPLVIDPVIASTVVQTGSIDVGNADIVYAPDAASGAGEWHVTYNQFFANGDWDCYVQRLTAAFVPVVGRTSIDFSSANIFRPKIAHSRFSALSLVVAENRITPIKVIGRFVNLTGATTTAQFDIALTAGKDSAFPDVGADPFGNGFQVVWDFAFSATDHDIYMRRVEPAIIPPTAPFTLIESNTFDQRNPSISKSCGGGSTSEDRHFVVFQSSAAFGGGGGWHIYGSMVRWSGGIIPVGGSNTFPIDTSAGSRTWPQVSSPTEPDVNGSQRALVVWTNEGINAGDIEVAAVNFAGSVLQRDNLLDMEGRVSAQAWPQAFASVDCDGSRFVVAYQELYSGTGGDLDVRCALVAAGDGELFAIDSAAPGFSSAPEFAAQVGSRYSSSGVPDDDVGISNDFDSPGTFEIQADVYRTVPMGRIDSRTTNCGGGVSISSTGNAIPGNTVTFNLASLSPIAGFAVGEAASLPIPGCPSCTLGVFNYTSLFGNSLPLVLPNALNLIGARLSFQGWMLGAATPTTCLGSIHLSDTLDLLVR
jgi:hypothetical protein